MKIKVNKPVEVDINVMKMYLKVRDDFCAEFVDTNNNSILNYEGYVPSFMPEEHYGDYVYLNIDIDTGQILNWDKDKFKKNFPKFIDGYVN